MCVCRGWHEKECKEKYVQGRYFLFVRDILLDGLVSQALQLNVH